MAAKNIVVTGSSGQVGSELRGIWHPDSALGTVFLDRKELDLSMPESVRPVMDAIRPDLIIHCGAFTAVDLAETETDLANRVNHLSTLEIAKYAGENGCKLLYISTDYVFPGDVDQALEEDYPTGPVNVYGQTKLWGEQAIGKHCPSAIIIRTSWVYSTYGKNFVKTMLDLMKSRDEISVVSDQIGSPTYARDLAELIGHVAKPGNWVPGTYHYSNEGRTSWYGFALMIREASGLNCKVNPIPSSQYPTPAERPLFSLLSKEKVKRTFGVTVPEWEVSLGRMLKDLSGR